LILDGAFFLDGEFAGPNEEGLWEKVVGEAEEFLRVARLAKQLHDQGTDPGRILAEIEKSTGPAPGPGGPPPRFPSGRSPDCGRHMARMAMAGLIRWDRQQNGDERAVYTLLEWASAPMPNYRRMPA